jgi:plastocyanin
MAPGKIGLVAIVALALASAGCGGSENESSSGGTTGGEAAAKTVTVTETEFAIDPKTVTVDAPGKVTFHVVNDGGITHALEIEGNGVEEETDGIDGGSSADLTVDLSKEGTYEVYCPIGNHRAMGMEASLVVGQSAGGGMTTNDDTSTGEDDSGDDDSGGAGY